MHVKKTTRGLGPGKQCQQLTVITLREDDTDHAPGSVRHVPGKDSVDITGTENGWPSITITGIEHITLLRDALEFICQSLEIPKATLLALSPDQPAVMLDKSESSDELPNSHLLHNGAWFALHEAEVAEPHGQAWFWFNGIPAPILHGDTPETLGKRWTVWRKFYRQVKNEKGNAP